MKRIGLLLAMTFAVTIFSGTAQAQTTYTWQGADTASWATAANWTPTRTTPAVTDILQFNTGTTLTITAVPTQTIGRFVISSGTSITLQAAAANALTIGNATGTDLDVPIGSALNLGTNVNVTLANSATANIAGTLTINSGRIYNTNGTTVVTTVTGTVTNSGTVTSTNAAKLLFQSASTYAHAQNGGTIPAATWDENSTCEITGMTAATSLAGDVQNFGHFTWNCPGQTSAFVLSNTLNIQGNLSFVNTNTGSFTFDQDNANIVGGNYSQSGGSVFNRNNSAHSLTISGSFMLSSGTLTNQGDNSPGGTLSVAGNFTHSGGTLDGGNLLTVVFNGSGTQTFTSGGTVSNIVSYTVNSGATVAIAIGSTVTVNAGATMTVTGTLDCGTGTAVSGAGSFVLSNNPTATLRIGSANGIVVAVGTASGNIQTTTARTFNIDANYTYNGTVAQDMGTGFPSGFTGVLTINNSGNSVTLDNARTIANTGAIDLTAGTLAAGANLTMATTSSITRSGGDMSGTPAGVGAYNVTYTGNSKTTGSELDGTGLNNVTVNLTGGQTLTLGAPIVADGTITLTAGTFNVSGSNFAISVGGNWTNNGGTFTPQAGTVTFNGGGTQTIGGSATSQTFNNVVVNKSGSTDLVNGGSLASLTVNDLTETLGDIALGTGITLNINGAFVHTVGTFNPGNNINIKGNWTRDGGTYTVSTSDTVTFNGTTTQTVSGSVATTFNNLTINSGATAQLTAGVSPVVNATIIVNGAIVMPDTVTVTNDGAATLTVGSTGLVQTADADGVTGAATTSFGINFTTTSLNTNGTVEYNRSGAQTITARTYLNLTSSSSGTKTLGGATTVAGILTLNVDITTGANTLTQTGTSAGSGDVVGTVSRSDLGAATTRAFGNPFVTITNVNTLAGSFTIALVKGSTPIHLATGVRRQYTLTNSAAGTVDATVRLHYLDSELNTNSEGSLELYRSDNSGASYGSQGVSGFDSTANWVEKSGINQFSPWGIAGPNAPTAVEMVGYSARGGRDGKTLLQWETGREVNNLGFNIYREENGTRVRINKSLIVGSGLMASPGTVMTAGRSYLWQTSDDQPKNSPFWVEEIDLSGYTVWHGPIYSQQSDAKLSPREQAIADQTITLSDMASESTFNGVTRPVQALANIPPSGGAFKLTGAVISPKPPVNPLNASVKISLKHEGWYRITQPQLVANGLNPSVDPGSLQLFADGKEIPISVISNNGSFDESSH